MQVVGYVHVRDIAMNFIHPVVVKVEIAVDLQKIVERKVYEHTPHSCTVPLLELIMVNSSTTWPLYNRGGCPGSWQNRWQWANELQTEQVCGCGAALCNDGEHEHEVQLPTGLKLL